MSQDVDESSLANKLRTWCEHPVVKGHNWAPSLFWRPAQNTAYGKLRVNPAELEVYLATLLGEESECKPQLDQGLEKRGSFLEINARRHELPLFTPYT